MKNRILLIVFLLNNILSNAQTPPWTWAKMAGGNHWDEGKCISTDADGNVFIAGLFTSSSIAFGNDTFSTTGGNDIFLAKYDSAGNALWAIKAGGLADDVAYGISTDTFGNVIVCGSFASDTISIGSFMLLNDGTNDQYDIFIAKLDYAGNVLWAKKAGGPLNEMAFSVTTDISGNSFITGYFESDTVAFDSNIVYNPYGNGFQDIFVSAFDPSGNSLWAKSFGDYGLNSGLSISDDYLGNIYIAGRFSYSSIKFGNDTLFNFGGSGNDMFITKLDNIGNVIWAKSAGGINSDYANGIACDAIGNSYVAGVFGSSTINFGDTVLNQSGSNDIFIVKYDPYGNEVWVKKAGSGCGENVSSIALNNTGNFFITGRFADCYSTLFDTISLNHTGYSSGDVFIAKFDTSGNALWAKAATGNGEESSGFVATDKFNNVMITGRFNSASLFFGNTELDNYGGGYSDIFIAKMPTTCYLGAPLLTASDTEFCWGDTVTLATSPAYAYLWSNAATTQVIQVVASGVYSVTVFDSIGCSMFTSPVTLSANPVPDEPVIIPDSSAVYCGSGILSSSYAYSYLWSDSSTSQFDTVSSSGIYWVTVANIYGCTASSEPVNVIVNANPPAPVISSISTSMCSGDSLTLTASNAEQYFWSTMDSVQSIIVSDPGDYFLSITDSNGCSSSSNITINEIIPDTAVICMVTVDSLSQNNIILWDKTQFTAGSSFVIHREISTNNYQPIASIPYDSLSQFVDTVRSLYFPNTGDPNYGTYRYKIQILDSCGNYGQMSSYHNTLFIMGNNGIFSWPQLYSIENGTNPVSSYILMRDDSSNGNWQALSSVAGTQQFIIDPQFSQYENIASWRVLTQWDIDCSPSKAATYASSLSNVYSKAIVSAKESAGISNIKIYPNPSKGEFFIHGYGSKIQTVEMYNVLGEMLFSIYNSNRESLIRVDISERNQGVYLLRVKSEEGCEVRRIIKE